MSRSRVATATEADWSFLADEDMVTACEWAARRAAREFEAVEFDDALQDAYLYLAVRPEMQAGYREGGYDGVSHFAQQVYKNGLWDRAVGDSNRAKRTVSREAMLEREVEEL